LFRYGVFLLNIRGGRNKYVDRSHVDGSGPIRLSSTKILFVF